MRRAVTFIVKPENVHFGLPKPAIDLSGHVRISSLVRALLRSTAGDKHALHSNGRRAQHDMRWRLRPLTG